MKRDEVYHLYFKLPYHPFWKYTILRSDIEKVVKYVDTYEEADSICYPKKKKKKKKVENIS